MFRLIQLLMTLLVAISLIRSVVKAFYRMFGTPAVQQSAAPAPAQAGSGEALHTVLQQDPVCGTYVSVDGAFKRIVKGRVFHFCSNECRDRYTA